MARIAARRVLIVVSALVVTLVVTVWAIGYHTFEFKGGTGIRDSGFFSYPRYHAELGQIPLWKDGEYQFTVSGLPSDSLDLTLQVPGATYDNTMELTSSSTSMSVSMTDSSGHVLCTVAGSLSDARRRGVGGWVLESSDSHAAFWYPGCQELPISRFNAYTVKVKVSGADDRAPHRMAMPVLAGGGNELP